jgi:hypothetical protein
MALLMRWLPAAAIGLALVVIAWRQRRRAWWVLLPLLLVSLALTKRGADAIEKVNAELAKHESKLAPSQELEWIYSPRSAGTIVDEWRNAGVLPLVRQGVDADTYSFIPFYPFLFFAASLLVARLLPPELRLHGWGVAIAWLALVAGAFDLAENCGIVHELRGGRWVSLAPLTASLALVKWVLLALNVYFVIGGLIAAALSAVLRR